MARLIVLTFAVLLVCSFVACNGTQQNYPGNQPTPSPTSTISNTNRNGDGVAFAITGPKTGSEVDRNIITVNGVGAKVGDSIEVSVLTDKWYIQDGKADIESDGSWTYSPCNLGGRGSYRLHHAIKAKLIRNGNTIATSTVDEIKAPEPSS